MESRKQPIGFLVKQINNVFEKDLNGRLKAIGVTSSQCAVLDYLFHTNKEEVSQRVSTWRDRPGPLHCADGQSAGPGCGAEPEFKKPNCNRTLEAAG